jgi:hypothetical protein
MKTNMIVRLGISMLVMLMTIGTVSADGGASYSDAESIYVPDGTFDIWSYTYTADDWYKFGVDNGDDLYVDLQKTFIDHGGELKVHDDYEGDIEAWVSVHIAITLQTYKHLQSPVLKSLLEVSSPTSSSLV